MGRKECIMALTENGTNTTMLLTPYTGGMPYPGGYGYGGNNGGLFGNGDSWLGILFLIALCNGGFGFGGGFGGFGGYGNMMLGYDFPWLLNGQNGINANVNSGFRDAQINDGITSVRDSIAAIATQLCNCCGDMQLNVSNGINSVNQNLSNGFAGVNQNVSSGFAGVNQNLCSGFAGVNAGINGVQNAITQQMYANQISDLERSFNAQVANTAGLTNISQQLANCCCENRQATNDVKYTIATEACNTRAANTANTQAILDKLCALELDTVKNQLAQAQRDNVGLQNQLNMANLAASQVAQTSELRTSQATIANQLVNELRSCPIPSQPVYGNQPIFTCNGNNNGCGCGSF